MIGHIRITGRVDGHLRSDLRDPRLGGYGHARDAAVFDQCAGNGSVQQVFAAHFIEDVHECDLQVLHIAEQGVPIHPCRLGAVGERPLDDKLMHRPAAAAGGPHLVDPHSHAVGGDATEEAVALQQQRLRARPRGGSRGADACRPTANDEHIHGAKLIHGSSPPCVGTPFGAQWGGACCRARRQWSARLLRRCLIPVTQ